MKAWQKEEAFNHARLKANATPADVPDPTALAIHWSIPRKRRQPA
jgi:hypothetical protein